jgi:hypothetical protein
MRPLFVFLLCPQISIDHSTEDIFPDYTVGLDGVAFSLPVNSDEIIRTSKWL